MIVKLKQSVYHKFREQYLNEILPTIENNIESEKRNGDLSSEELDELKSILKELLTEPLEKEENENPFISNYRKTMCLAYSNLTKGKLEEFWKYMEGIELPGINQMGKNTFYKYIRNEMIKENNNPMISDLLEEPNDYASSNVTFNQLQNAIKEKYERQAKIYENIFNYNDFDTYLRREILSSTEVNICPYCNRQFVNAYELDQEMNGSSEIRVIAQLDHFYPKSKFPLFSLSLYNFVPSCGYCNMTLKNDKIYDYIYPFKNDENQNRFFDIEVSNYAQAIGYEKPKIKLAKPREWNLETLHRKYVFEKLHLESIYEYHEEFVRLLTIKNNLYQSEYRDHLERIIPSEYTGDTKELILGYSEEEDELYTKPLSKLAHDILGWDSYQ